MKGMIGKKVGMTQVFDEQGTVIPVTVIQAGPCYVTQVRNVDRDGYVSVQLGYGETKPKGLTKGQLGHLQKLDLPALRHIREFRLAETTDVAVEEGQEIKVDIFEQGELVDVIGTSKGRGHAGTIKRHGFSVVPRHTVSLTGCVPRAQLACARRRAVRSKARRWRGVWAMIG